MTGLVPTAYKRKGVACPSYVHVGQSDSAVQGDTFPVAALLQAAGIDSLDASSALCGTPVLSQGAHLRCACLLCWSGHVDSSMRFDGAILVVSIVYTNYDSYDPNRVSYTMSVEHVANTEFKVVEVRNRGLCGVYHVASTCAAQRIAVIPRSRCRWAHTPAAESPRNPHSDHAEWCVVLTFSWLLGVVPCCNAAFCCGTLVVSGTIGRFAFQTLLVQLVSTFGLVAVITMVMDLFLQYCAASKFIYRQYKTVSSLKVAQYAGAMPIVQ